VEEDLRETLMPSDQQEELSEEMEDALLRDPVAFLVDEYNPVSQD